MTGFGQYRGDEGSCSHVWEVRSVNSRYLDVKWRLPSQARHLEARLEKALRRAAARGRVELTLTLQKNAGPDAVRFDAAQAGALFDALAEFARSRGEEFRPDYAALLALPQVWSAGEEADDDETAQLLERGLGLALADWNASREAEARDLADDLRQRFARMDEWVGAMEARAPAIKEERFRQVRDRLSDMLAAHGTELEDARFLQEMVIMADKLDVSEELTRLRSHLARLRDMLGADDAGRKLDFTLQECFREINTCGNKIQDADISRLVVDFKNELEKCREQVQNLE